MTDEYPPDEEPWEYRFEQDTGRYMLGYSASGGVSHIINRDIDLAQCGMDRWDWFGTGTQQEREHAHRLPLCKKCESKTQMGLLEKVAL